jgi:hypothetical protein
MIDMNDRIMKFDSFKKHAMLGRLYMRLTALELNIAHSFIKEHSEASKNDFDRAVNRLFINRDKPRHWLEIMELLSCCSSR